MVDRTADPKNYYGILGVSPDADADTIKSAFRTKAKRLHPDANPDPKAAEHFQRLNEAYGVVGDPDKRRQYHAKAAKKARDASKPKPGPKPQPKAQAKPQPKAKPKPEPKPAPQPERKPPPKANFHACKCCGTLSAQPRVIAFQEVTGRPFAAQQETVSGVYCPRCAGDEAVRSSLNTWVRGMLAVPKGPLLSMKALWCNLWGGERPIEANARMLISQARAFLGRGDVDLARATIAQALPFAEKTAYRHEAETLLSSLNFSSQKTLRNQWSRFGKAFWLQVAPFAGVLAIVIGAMAFSLMRGEGTDVEVAKPEATAVTTVSKALVELPSGPNTPLPTYVTVRDKVPLRNAPSGQARAVRFVAKNSTVTMTAIVPREKWVQVRLYDGTSGFMVLDDLK